MKVIDLLNKIANGVEAPKKIKYLNTEWDIKYLSTNNKSDYYSDDEGYLSCNLNLEDLKNEIEIIGDTPKVQVEMTQEEYNEYLDRKLNIPKEDKKLAKIDLKEIINNREAVVLNDTYLACFINSIIDKINGE